MHSKFFDLNLINALHALLSEQSVTRAAARLCVTQQAMSGSLRRLRDYFDDELLVMVGRRLEPTPLGQALRLPIRELALQIPLTLETKAHFDPGASSRHFRIALSDYASITFLPHFMPLLRAQASGIVCEFLPIDNSVFRNVEEGSLDFCLLPSNWRLYQDIQPQGLRTLPIFEDDFVCVVDRENRDVGDVMSKEQYARQAHSVVHFESGVRSLIEHAWSVAGLDLNVAATATSFVSLLFMVPRTKLVATAQRKLFHAVAPLLPVRIVECPIPIERLTETLSWHIRNENDPGHRFMRGLLASAGEALALG